ncbi:hypothetical protein M3Y95_00793500 [Aphelenchoides besseyi]|nr:hypothetical protein M3Y95_00793500 [Aphelenchoides besseyi]
MSAGKPVQIRPDYDYDVLWKGPQYKNRTRTVSVDSTSSDLSVGAPQQRRFSISEYFGSPFLQRQPSISESNDLPPLQKKSSVTDNADFQEFLKRQKRILE